MLIRALTAYTLIGTVAAIVWALDSEGRALEAEIEAQAEELHRRAAAGLFAIEPTERTNPS
ncbi:hypothetical protein [Kitasatospora sp. NBC_01266]|uniref:hypothetical protein n=1 Tax=Kitasatospora sp. NBC_01266 TaxID=2903572 RepID=UPI002E31D253|nr:hypothetical protein [Kitasatospora sp. NBC_01266]